MLPFQHVVKVSPLIWHKYHQQGPWQVDLDSHTNTQEYPVVINTVKYQQVLYIARCVSTIAGSSVPVVATLDILIV